MEGERGTVHRRLQVAGWACHGSKQRTLVRRHEGDKYIDFHFGAFELEYISVSIFLIDGREGRKYGTSFYAVKDRPS